MLNPFVYDRPVAPNDLIDREQELGVLADLAESGQSTRLSGPRRYGKTTLLGRVAQTMRDDRGFAVASVDLSRVTSLPDVVLRLSAAYERGFTGPLRGAWQALRRRVTPSATFGVPGVAGVALTAAAGGDDPLATLHDLLEVPVRLHERTKRRCLVVFDEFQELLTAQPDLDGVLRSHIQHHGEAASYIFAGSHAGMMDALFGDRRRPLFEQARTIEVGPVPLADLAEFIEARFVESGRDLDGMTVDSLTELAAGHPQRTMLIAHFLWDELDAEAREDALSRAYEKALAEAEEGLERTWQSLSANQRKLVGVVAAGETHPLRKAALQGADTAKTSMAQARDALVAQGDLFITGVGRVMLADPFLGAWIRRAQTGS